MSISPLCIKFCKFQNPVVPIELKQSISAVIPSGRLLKKNASWWYRHPGVRFVILHRDGFHYDLSSLHMLNKLISISFHLRMNFRGKNGIEISCSCSPNLIFLTQSQQCNTVHLVECLYICIFLMGTLPFLLRKCPCLSSPFPFE